MATSIKAPAYWANSTTHHTNINILQKYLAYADSQSDRKTLWFLISMIFQGIFFLPLPAVLIFYFGAPVFILIITLGLFFANLIAGMGGAGIRTIFGLFALSILVHLIMAVLFML
jgi:hypothetical protein